MPARLPLIVLAAALLPGCTHSAGGSATPAAEELRIESGPVTVVEDAPAAGVAYVSGDRVHGVPGREEPLELAASMNELLIAHVAPAALLDADENRLLYNSWRGRRPVVRAHDLESGEDVVLVDRGYAVALRGDGALAFFEPPDEDLEDPRRYLGHVVVRTGGREERWTTEPGRFVVAAWAQDRLLVYRVGARSPDLLVLDGRGRQRVLAEGSALIALSPDGSRAFVSTYGAQPPVVRVLEVATGEERVRLELDPADVEWVSESGSWVRGLVAAAASDGVAVFRVSDTAIELEQVLRFEAAELPQAVYEPRLSDDGETVAVTGELPPRPRQAIAEAAVVTCVRLTRACAIVSTAPHVDGPRLVYDPSRP